MRSERWAGEQNLMGLVSKKEYQKAYLAASFLYLVLSTLAFLVKGSLSRARKWPVQATSPEPNPPRKAGSSASCCKEYISVV